jgi:Flp pilus assembly protein CpaB
MSGTTTTAVREGERGSEGAGRRRVPGRPVLPSTRAVVGGLLLAVAAVVTFTTWQSAAGTPDTSFAVADRSLRPGERVGAADVRVVPVELPAGLAARAFTRAEEVVGRVALGPIGEDELLQQGQLSDAASTVPRVEVSFALTRDRALDGQLRSGDRVDVFATYDDRTDEVVRGAQVVGVGDGDPSLAAGDQVTVTLALEDVDRRAALVHAVRAGEVTLVRSTLSAGAWEASGSGAPARPAAGSTPGTVSGSSPGGDIGPGAPGGPGTGAATRTGADAAPAEGDAGGTEGDVGAGTVPGGGGPVGGAGGAPGIDADAFVSGGVVDGRSG